MIKETGRVVAIDKHHLWLDTINKTTCGSCEAQAGCGQSLLNRWMTRTSFLKVSLDGRSASDFQLHDEVTVGIPENVVVLSSILMYCLPLAGLVLGAGIAFATYAHDVASIIGAMLGLCMGACVVRGFSWWHRDNPAYKPVIISLIEA